MPRTTTAPMQTYGTCVCPTTPFLRPHHNSRRAPTPSTYEKRQAPTPPTNFDKRHHEKRRADTENDKRPRKTTSAHGKRQAPTENDKRPPHPRIVTSAHHEKRRADTENDERPQKTMSTHLHLHEHPPPPDGTPTQNANAERRQGLCSHPRRSVLLPEEGQGEGQGEEEEEEEALAELEDEVVVDKPRHGGKRGKDVILNKGGKKGKKGRKTSAQKNAEVAAEEAKRVKKQTHTMKLLTQRGISVAPPARAAVSAAPAASSIPSSSAASSVPVVPDVQAIPATLVPAVADIHAISAVSPAMPTVSAVSAIPTASTGSAISTVSTVSAAVSAAVLSISNTTVPISTTAPLTSGDEPGDVSMESPPRPEGSSCATGGILRNRAMGQHYNPVDDEDFQIAPVLGKVKGVVKIYVLPLDPVELEFATMQPSLKVPVTVNMNLGPVLKEVALHWPPITRNRILVYDALDGLWMAQGLYDIVVEINDTILFDNSGDKATLHLLVSSFEPGISFSSIPPSRARSLQGGSLPSTSRSATPHSSVRSHSRSHSLSTSGDIQTGSIEPADAVPTQKDAEDLGTTFSPYESSLLHILNIPMDLTRSATAKSLSEVFTLPLLFRADSVRLRQIFR
ncbi:uncharacterized protein LACBIDRAFT_328056 [Laccaria bicolor S238N-H82]|uniref:Predicted protein n=1 Tax=Laccaria bicolor (strain S238N-H82 / ATCC MYA-4686) TaxID=486041 RepID=B0DDL9_LACBS|nr:uncharacterized protein LACBIDRAFT_328056 [Laccaria bicolor S238N-H82]EDR07112.1 predicted protein [Laccaria bicolor S238N-H82]|eukprot:XP_001882043.1 predicted protein [Laccaria bicolor S238N-H82]